MKDESTNPMYIRMHNYFTTVTWEHDLRDADLETILSGICTCLNGLGWDQDAILTAMNDYAEDRLPKRNYNNETTDD